MRGFVFFLASILMERIIFCQEVMQRKGSTFVHEDFISLDFGTWNILTLMDGFAFEESQRSYQNQLNLLYEEFQKAKFVHRRNPDLLQLKSKYQFVEDEDIEKQFEDVYKLSKSTEDKIEQLMIYSGEDSRVKRSSQYTALAALAGKVGAHIFGIGTKSENLEIIDHFSTIVEKELHQVNETVADMVNLTELQVSLNKKIFKILGSLEERYLYLVEEMKTLKENQDRRLKTQYLLQYLKEMLLELNRFTQRCITGIVQSTKGVASPPFVSPSKMLSVIEEFHKTSNEKSVLEKKHVLELFDLSKVTVTKVDGKVGVLTQVRIPTTTTVGRLFRIKTFPLLHEDEEKK